MPRFIHPIHARGLRSTSIPNPSSPLTDRKIRAYILAGRYGEEAKKAEEARTSRPKRKAKSLPTLSPKDFRHLL